MKIETILIALLVLLAGCDPGLDSQSAGPSDGGALDGGVTVTVSTQPAAALEAAPPVVHIVVKADGGAIDPTRVALVEGTLGSGQLREFTKGQLSSALAKRVVPSIAWAEQSRVVLAPSAPLAASTIYTLVGGDPATGTEITVAQSDAVPTLERIWPLAGSAWSSSFAVWCRATALPPVDMITAMEPGPVKGRLRRGIVAGGAGARCLHFEASSAPIHAGDGAVPPPLLADSQGQPIARLDPRPLLADASPATIVGLSCVGNELNFGPGCATVEDDRLRVRSGSITLLWAVAGAGADVVQVTQAGEPFVVGRLSPETDVVLDVAVVDGGGNVGRSTFAAHTGAARAHVVLNEVLANPLGAEPAQEWVEIVNDGSVPAELGGYQILDVGGVTVLPSAILPPGGFALVVNDSYVLEDGVDPAPPTDALVLRVPHLGKGGLSNSGEPLTLKDGTGAVVSTFPAIANVAAGKSVARRAPSALDELPSSFAVATPTPGRPNGL